MPPRFVRPRLSAFARALGYELLVVKKRLPEALAACVDCAVVLGQGEVVVGLASGSGLLCARCAVARKVLENGPVGRA